MTDEPMVERLTAANVELIYEHTGERHDPACPFAIEYGQVSPSVCTCPHIVGQWDSHDRMQATIDALLSQLREQEERAGGVSALRWRQRAITAEQRIAAMQAEWAKTIESQDAIRAAAERTVREQREALEAISEFGCDECGDAGDTCLDRHPTEPNEWCQTCTALAALAPDTEGEGT